MKTQTSLGERPKRTGVPLKVSLATNAVLLALLWYQGRGRRRECRHRPRLVTRMLCA